MEEKVYSININITKFDFYTLYRFFPLYHYVSIKRYIEIRNFILFVCCKVFSGPLKGANKHSFIVIFVLLFIPSSTVEAEVFD